MGKRRTFLILLLLPLMIIVVCPSQTLGADTSKFWVFDSGDNISDFTIANGKVFVMTFNGGLFCLDEIGGSTIWLFDSEGYSEQNIGQQIRVANGKVFVGSQGSVLSCLDEMTGILLWQFKPTLVTNNTKESIPRFSIVDGRAYTSGDGFFVLDVNSGDLLWSFEDQQSCARAVLN